MSTETQLRGDSLRRQVEESRKYAEEHGLELDCDLTDIGVSAFKGANVSNGALGTFLKAVENGQIAPGSYLLVESLDRISRQNPAKAASLFFDILKYGINIVTFADRKLYTKDDLSFENLMYSILIMQRSYEESQSKSRRISQAWANKRLNAKTKKLTSWCPAWLKLDRDKNQFILINNKADIVREIFRLSLQGFGALAIARTLNGRGIEAFSSRIGWNSSYIKKILKNRAAIGEFQPFEIINGQRRPAGPAIADYFPCVISVEEFNAVSVGILARGGHGGGRKGDAFSNLFSGVSYCGYCSGKLYYINKGQPPKGLNYLRCKKSTLQFECSAPGWRYDQFELVILSHLTELNIVELVSSGAERIEKLQASVDEIAKRKKIVNERINLAYNMLGSDPEKFGLLKEKISNDIDELANMDREIAILLSEIHEQSDLKNSDQQFKSAIDKLLSRDKTVSKEEIYELRSKLAALIKRIIVRMDLYPRGWLPKIQRSIDFIGSQRDITNRDEIISIFKKQALAKNSSNPFVSILFAGGGIRIIEKNSAEIDDSFYGFRWLPAESKNVTMSDGIINILLKNPPGYAEIGDDLDELLSGI